MRPRSSAHTRSRSSLARSRGCPEFVALSGSNSGHPLASLLLLTQTRVRVGNARATSPDTRAGRRTGCRVPWGAHSGGRSLLAGRADVLCAGPAAPPTMRAEGFEPPRLSAPAPKAGVSTSSTTPAAESIVRLKLWVQRVRRAKRRCDGPRSRCCAGWAASTGARGARRWRRKGPRTSAERFENDQRGYSYCATRGCGRSCTRRPGPAASSAARHSSTIPRYAKSAVITSW
jgi:hypothetical protein